jgi:predicted acetyltransferase
LTTPLSATEFTRPRPTPPLALQLVWPARAHLAGYTQALQRGWSPNNLRPEAAQEELALIEKDAKAFLQSLDSRVALGEPVTMPDGSQAPRLPGYRRWMWLGDTENGEFCGSIGFRWATFPDGSITEALPSYCLGHIGYAVVPWKQRQGCATAALGLLLKEARPLGLRFVEITTQPDNLASQKVIRANGGVLVEEFITVASLGGQPELRFRIDLQA